MFQRRVGVLDFVYFHLFQDGATFFVLRRQPVKMSFEMAFDLALGFGEKTQVPFVAQQACRRAEREVVALTHEEPMHPIVVSYLNRLSDWLFALARAENATAGVADVQWVAKG